MNHSQKTKRRDFLILASGAIGGVVGAKPSGKEPQDPSYVSLKDAHIGTVEIDLRIMNQFGEQPKEVQDFYVACRSALTGKNADEKVTEVCRKFKRPVLGGPMLGNLTTTSVAVWMHLHEAVPVKVVVEKERGE